MRESTIGPGSLLKWLALVLSLAGLVIVAVLLFPKKERATMLPTAMPAETTTKMTAETTAEPAAETAAETARGVPPIDANAPTQTKTATFAMG